MRSNGKDSFTSFSLHNHHLSSLSLPAAISPDEFSSSSTFDLISIFSSRESKERYRGDKSCCLNILSYPQIALRSMRHIQSLFTSSVGVHPLSSACINYGIFKLSSHPSIESLIQARYRFYSSINFSSLPGLVASSLDNYLKTFSFDLPSPERANIFLPEDVFSSLNGISSMIGVKSHRLASLSILYSLASQSNMNDSDRQEANNYIAGFFDLASIKTRAANSLMNEFGIPEIGNREVEIDWKEIQ